MKKQRILFALLGLLVGWGGAGMAQATGVTFQITDNPGSWFECTASDSKTGVGCVHNALGEPTVGKSLSVIQRGESITFQSRTPHHGSTANTIHTVVSLIYPHPASTPTGIFTAMPFDTDIDVGTISAPIIPNELGLHVFFCDIHPYMFATVIVVPADHNLAAGNLFPLDLGKTVDLHNVVAPTLAGLPTASDLALRLVHTFFIITNPANWQEYPVSGIVDWKPAYPGVPVVAYDKDGHVFNNAPVNLNGLLHTYFGEGGLQLNGTSSTQYKQLSAPSMVGQTAGVGQVWVDTQFEMMSQKLKPGTATAVDATSFKVVRKVGLPQINCRDHNGPCDGMNNPHNMWTDRDQKVIYQTQWFDTKLAVFNRTSGDLVRNIEAGPAPAHVMTRTNNDQVHVSQNGGNNVRELASLEAGNGFLKDIPMGDRTPEDVANGEPDAHTHPHAHWMSHDGSMMVTPNADTENSTLYNFPSHSFKQAPVGHFPIASGMMPDSSKYYVANFLDSSITVITIDKSSGTPTPKDSTTINLLGDAPHGVTAYDPFGLSGISPVGGLPIQIPVSPDGKYAIVANTLAARILVIDTSNDKVVAILQCDAGCHGVQFGAKKGGGYYAYVSSKFSNRLIVVDPKNGSDASIIGSVLLTTDNESSHFKSDGTVSKYPGMGGQGVLPIPLVYNGWVQNLPEEWKEKLTTQQKHPFPTH